MDTGAATQQPAQVTERIFTPEEAERHIRRRQKRRWAWRMVAAFVLLFGVVIGPFVFDHLRTGLWLVLVGANVDWQFNEDNWKEGGYTTVSFPIAFRTNDQFKNEDVALLRRLHRLEDLDLSNTYDVSSLGLKDLARLPDLKVLDLGRIDDKNPNVNAPPPKYFDDALVAIAPLTNLRELYLPGNRITDNGLVQLAGLQNLEILDLEETDVTDAGLVHLKGLTKLHTLRLGKAKGDKKVISKEAAMELNRSLPELVIHLKKEFESE